jgi:hypothetical protein
MDGEEEDLTMDWKELGARSPIGVLGLALAVTVLAVPPARALPLAPSPEGDGYVVRFVPADLGLELA